MQSQSELDKEINLVRSLDFQARYQSQPVSARQTQERMSRQLKGKNRRDIENYILSNTTLYRSCDIGALSYERLVSTYERIRDAQRDL